MPDRDRLLLVPGSPEVAQGLADLLDRLGDGKWKARAEAAEARLAALRQAVEALAEEWDGENLGLLVAMGFDPAARLRAILAEHATPSDDTAAMRIDPNPPGVTPLPPEQAREILDGLDDADTEGVRLTEGEGEA